MSQVLILLARFLSLRCLQVLEFWCNRLMLRREVVFWFCLLSLPASLSDSSCLPPPGPELPTKVWPWAAGGFLIVVLLSWRGPRATPQCQALGLGPLSCVVWDTGLCHPWVCFLPSAPRSALCRHSASHAQRWLSCLWVQYLSATSACLEQRGCVRTWFYGTFLTSDTPLYLLRRKECGKVWREKKEGNCSVSQECGHHHFLYLATILWGRNVFSRFTRG